MLISDVLTAKGSAVFTVSPDTTIRSLLDTLTERHIGAVIVTSAPGAVVGIISERDIVRQLHARGAGLLDATVADLMTREVYSCLPGDSVDQALQIMTQRRFRHLPVIADGALLGLVSIGDLVKQRIDELKDERDHLTAYIAG